MRRKVNKIITQLNHIINVDIPILEALIEQHSGQITALEKRVADLAHPLTLAITAPANNATVSGSAVTLTATCTCPSAHTIKSVTFYIWDDRVGWVQIAEDLVTPFTTTLNATQYSNGSHKLRVVGACVSGGSSSVEITVTIDNTIPAGGTGAGGTTSGYGCVISINVDAPTPGSQIDKTFLLIGRCASSAGHAFLSSGLSIKRIVDGVVFTNGSIGPGGWVCALSLGDIFSNSFEITITDINGDTKTKTVTFYNIAYINSGQVGWQGLQQPL